MPCDFLTLVPAGQWWMATWMIDADHELYVDITTPATWGSGVGRVVDLDLDIQRWPDGRVELLDESEFEERRHSLGYPADVVASARDSAQAVLTAVKASSHPFGPVPTRWLEKAAESIG